MGGTITPMDPGVTAVVADEWPLVRLGIVHALRSRGVDVIAEARDGEEALQHLAGRGATFLVIGPVRDLAAPDVAKRAVKIAPDVKVLVLVDAVRREELAVLAGSGADALLVRSVNAVDLLDALDRVARGERVIAPALVPMLMGGVNGPAPTEDAAAGGELTRKELEIVARLVEGGTNREIAEALFVTPATVKTHLSHIYAKLGVAGRQEAIGEAMARGLLR